jgi:hypothetical protein
VALDALDAARHVVSAVVTGRPGAPRPRDTFLKPSWSKKSFMLSTDGVPADDSAKEPTAEELMSKFLAPIKAEFRLKKSTAPVVKEARVPAVPPTENPIAEDLAEKEETEGNDSSKDFKKRKDARGQNRDSKRHKGYETVRSVRCSRTTDSVF